MYDYIKFKKIKKMCSLFLGLKQTSNLANLLGTTAYQLNLLTLDQNYNIFQLRKAGGIRIIEAPTGKLMKILKIIKNYLQAVYYYYKTDAAYGYVLQPANDKLKRNILTNAKHHLGFDYMLNIDLEDFFHQIKIQDISNVFSYSPFKYDQDLVNILSSLTTFNGRLPMGSPTSPPLSNFAMIPVDLELLNFAKRENLRFTRFVDDLTFSSNKPFTASMFHNEAV